MAKFYSKNPFGREELHPKKETIKFLLNYSKALKVATYNKLKFEAVLN